MHLFNTLALINKREANCFLKKEYDKNHSGDEHEFPRCLSPSLECEGKTPSLSSSLPEPQCFKQCLAHTVCSINTC